jgi:decaprenylphospho-beta-D-ribofuranose 2-oxidase
VHGKNHEKAGSFTQYVVWLDLLTPDGVVRRIGPEAEPALFRATCGGLGLTGVILRAAVRLQRVASAGVAVTSRRLADLDAFLAAIDDAAGAAYTVGWIDGTARGRHLGRGILETAELAASAPAQAPGGSLAVPFDFPGFALNPLSIGAFNALYFRHAPAVARTRVMRIERFFYPLDALRGWNRIYGRRGFYQFQCVVPFAEGAQAVRALMEVIAASGRASFLTTLKRLGDGAGGAEGYLSFPRAGYTLALDFPNAAGIEALYARLVEMTLRFGGRVYLAKDALLSAAAFRDMYPRWPEFRAVLEAVDPAARMQSDMARRLELRAA